MNDILKSLIALQDMEFGSAPKASEAEVEALRQKVPAPILGHFDRLLARGKKGVAIIRNQVCTGCHMRLPIGTINTLMQGLDIQLWDTCGRYLYLAVPDKAEPEVPPPAPVPSKRKTAKAKTPKAKKT